MIRQAHIYLAGAVSGTALIVAAVVAFVLLVSLQAVKDWPLSGLVGGQGKAKVAPAQRVATGAGKRSASGAAPGTTGQREVTGGETTLAKAGGGSPVHETATVGDSPSSPSGGSANGPAGGKAPTAGADGGPGGANSGTPDSPVPSAPEATPTAPGTGTEGSSGAPAGVTEVVSEVGTRATGAGSAAAGGAGHTVEGVVNEVAGTRSVVGGGITGTVEEVGSGSATSERGGARAEGKAPWTAVDGGPGDANSESSDPPVSSIPAPGTAAEGSPDATAGATELGTPAAGAGSAVASGGGQSGEGLVEEVAAPCPPVGGTIAGTLEAVGCLLAGGH